MKQIFYCLMAAALLLASSSCRHNSPKTDVADSASTDSVAVDDSVYAIENDLAKMRFADGVKEVREDHYSFNWGSDEVQSAYSKVYAFDEHGNLVSESTHDTSFADAPDTKFSYQLTYDPQGRLSLVERYLNGDFYDRASYAYNDHNKVTEIHTDDNFYKSDTYMKYDSRDNLVSSKSEQNSETLAITYDDNGRMKSVKRTAESGELKIKSLVTYSYTPEGRISQIETSTHDDEENEDHIDRVSFKYNAKGLLVEETQNYYDCEPMTDKYSYDGQGSLIKKEHYQAGALRERSTYKITYCK